MECIFSYFTIFLFPGMIRNFNSGETGKSMQLFQELWKLVLLQFLTWRTERSLETYFLLWICFPESLWSDVNCFGVVYISVSINCRSLQGVDLQQLKTRFLKVHSFHVCLYFHPSQWDENQGAIMNSRSNNSHHSALE